jgi:hypothetical protein
MRVNLPGLGMLSGWSIQSNVIGDSDQCRHSETARLMTLIAQSVSLSTHRDSWG